MLTKDRIVIPKDALRIRVIANSNSKYDQEIKNGVKNIIEKDLYDTIREVKTVEEARKTVISNLDTYDTNISNYLKFQDYNLPYNIDYGYHYFPQKEYKGIKYDEGMYESLVVTLGTGKGDNWWCVMFPPFCLIEAQDNQKDDIEYRWYIKDMLSKYFSN